MNSFGYQFHDQYNNPTINNTECSLSKLITTVWKIMDQLKIELSNLLNEDWSPTSQTWSNRSSEEDRLTVIGAVEDVIKIQMRG